MASGDVEKLEHRHGSKNSLAYRFTMAICLTATVYSAIAWAYVCIRIVVSKVDPFSEFINGIPINFLQIGMITFLMSSVWFCAFFFLRGLRA